MVKKISGSVVEVLQRAQYLTQAQITEVISNRGYDQNKYTITVDLPRTALVDFTGKTFANFSEEILQESVFANTYVQGNLDGAAVLGDVYEPHFREKAKPLSDAIQLFQEAAKSASDTDLQHAYRRYANYFDEENTRIYAQALSSELRRDIRFAYRDDQDILCAFCLIYKKESTKPESAEKNWMVQIIKHTNAPLDERQVILFTQGEFLPKVNDADIDVAGFAEAMQLALGSEKVSHLIADLFTAEGEICSFAFAELSERIITNQNIDNRDRRTIQFTAFVEQVTSILPSMAVFLSHFQSQAQNDINFFENSDFAETLETIFNEANLTIAKSECVSDCKTASFKIKQAYYVIKLELLHDIQGGDPKVIAQLSALDAQTPGHQLLLEQCAAIIDNNKNFFKRSQMIPITMAVSFLALVCGMLFLTGFLAPLSTIVAASLGLTVIGKIVFDERKQVPNVSLESLLASIEVPDATNTIPRSNAAELLGTQRDLSLQHPELIDALMGGVEQGDGALPASPRLSAAEQSEENDSNLKLEQALRF